MILFSLSSIVNALVQRCQINSEMKYATQKKKVFQFQWFFWLSVPRRVFPGCSLGESTQIGDLLRSYLRENAQAHVNLVSICYQDIDTGDYLKCYVIIQGLATTFQQAWSVYLGKTLSLGVICFSSEKSLLSDHQMISSFSQEFSCFFTVLDLLDLLWI